MEHYHTDINIPQLIQARLFPSRSNVYTLCTYIPYAPGAGRHGRVILFSTSASGEILFTLNSFLSFASLISGHPLFSNGISLGRAISHFR